MAITAEMKPPRARAALNQLDQLKQYTRVVADTGDYATLKEFSPQDATTNPSLILKAAQMPEYQSVIEQAIAEGKQSRLSGEALVKNIANWVLVRFGLEILKIIPGRVSTETDADLAFDPEGLQREARQLIAMYEENGMPRERILIKLASTWEGIVAARQLQQEGINCNMTLLFSLTQAVAAAEAGAKLISPFVGRILDWYKKNTGKDYAPADDPGVQSVREIYAYYKNLGYPTEVMGASFRNVGEILELAGGDLLTISPHLMAELKNSFDPVERKLSPEWAHRQKVQRITLDEKSFRLQLNENAMATEKLAEGIRLFAADARKLQQFIRERV